MQSLAYVYYNFFIVDINLIIGVIPMPTKD